MSGPTPRFHNQNRRAPPLGPSPPRAKTLPGCVRPERGCGSWPDAGGGLGENAGRSPRCGAWPQAVWSHFDDGPPARTVNPPPPRGGSSMRSPSDAWSNGFRVGRGPVPPRGSSNHSARDLQRELPVGRRQEFGSRLSFCAGPPVSRVAEQELWAGRFSSGNAGARGAQRPASFLSPRLTTKAIKPALPVSGPGERA